MYNKLYKKNLSQNPQYSLLPGRQIQGNLGNSQIQGNLETSQILGELIDNSPDKDKIYSIFTNYYENPIFYKLRDIQNDGISTHSLYICKISSGTTIDKRYIICITPSDIHPIMNRMNMSDLKWESLQSRTLPENYNIPSHSYRFKRDSPYNSIITRGIYEDSYTEYICDNLSLKITMLHTNSNNSNSNQNSHNNNNNSHNNKKPDKYEYISVEKSMLNVALEQYSTIITFT